MKRTQTNFHRKLTGVLITSASTISSAAPRSPSNLWYSSGEEKGGLDEANANCCVGGWKISPSSCSDRFPAVSPPVINLDNRRPRERSEITTDPGSRPQRATPEGVTGLKTLALSRIRRRREDDQLTSYRIEDEGFESEI